MWLKLAGLSAASKILSIFNKEYGRKYIVERISEIPGLPSKAGQFLGDKFQLNNIKKPQAIPVTEIASLLRQHLSNEVFQKITDISDESKTASLGQVHKVKIKDMHFDVACKVQYPGIDKAMEDQLQKMIQLFFMSSKGKSFGLNREDYEYFLTGLFLEEVDYLNEASNQNIFYKGFFNHKYVQIPKPLIEMSTQKILFQEFILPESLFDRVNAKKWVHYLFNFQLESLFRLNAIHTDLQPDNWGIDIKNDKLIIYDFGSILKFSEEHIQAFKDIVSLLREGGSDNEIINTFSQLGFDKNKLSNIRISMNKLGNILFAPFLVDHPWNFKTNSWVSQLSEISHEDEWWLRSACPFWFLIFMRPFFQLSSLASKYEVEVPLYEMINDWMFQSEMPFLNEQGGGKVSLRGQSNTKNSAIKVYRTKLRVQIIKQGIQTADIELPAGSLLNIEDLLPEGIFEKLQVQGIYLDEIKNKAKKLDFSPQVLFEYQETDKICKVWLE